MTVPAEFAGGYRLRKCLNYHKGEDKQRWHQFRFHIRILPIHEIIEFKNPSQSAHSVLCYRERD